MRALLLLPLVAMFHASTAEACSCAEVTEEEASAAAEVVANGTVVLVAAEGRISASFTVKLASKGARPGEVLQVRFVRPNGFSCNLVDLRPGEWTLYLQRDPEGALRVAGCDQHSKLRKAAANASLPREVALLYALWEAEGALRMAARRALRAEPLPRLTAAQAQVRSLGPDGWYFRWSCDAATGWSYEAQIEVNHAGKAAVKRAEASFAAPE